jgi:TP901 family phage tail tape measure protein
VSVVASVAINVDSRDAVQKLRQVEQVSSKLDKTYQDVNGRLQDANGRFVKLGDAAQGASKKVDILGNAVRNLASQLVVADLARRFFKGFDEAEKAAAAVRTLGVDSKALEGQLLAVSNRLGGLFSQTQLLAASYDVASAGFANSADNAKILEASAKGAVGGLSDINTVGNAVTSVLNAYGKSANDAAILVDGFIQTQNDGKIVLNEYAQQIGKLAPTAAAAGVGITELNAAVATITAQGVPVEATFTGLNQALVSILKPSKDASDLAEALGIDFNEAGLRAKGFGGLLQEVKEKTGGSTTAMVKLFGSVDALKAVLPLVNDNLVKYNQNIENQVKASGGADKATKELGGTVSSEVSKMINQIGNLTRSLDTVLGPALGGIVKLINVVIAEATRGINVLGQLFSLGKNTTILKGALESGDLRGSAAARIIPGVDELIGQQRRQQLQRQAGAGTGLLGLGFDAQKFAELLKQQPEIQRLLGAGTAPSAGDRPTAGVDPAIQALLDSLDAGSKSGGGKEKDRAAEEEKRLQARIRGLQIETEGTKQLALIKGKIAEAEILGNDELAIRLKGEERNQQILLDYQKSLEDVTDEREQQALLVRTLAELDAAGIETAIDLERQRLEVIKEQNKEFFKRAGLTPTDKMPGGAGAFDPSLPDLRVSPAEQQMTRMREELEALTNPINIAVNGANAIGDAFAQAFQGIVTGSQTAQEALASAFNAIGKAFVQMATQIIAQQIAMIAFQAILKALGGGGSFSFGGEGPVSMPGGGGFAEGFKLPNLLPTRANGGPASGGQPYLVGERGPELFVPSTNGGVMSNNDLRSAMGAGPGRAGGSPVLNMSFQTTNIGGIEYVSRDQLDQAMAETRRAAARDGANRGMTMTLDKLQQSPSTRNRVGIR